MANKEHLKTIDQGVKAWKQWRESNTAIIPDLSGADLSSRVLPHVNLVAGNLARTNLTMADLNHGYFTNADLREADLSAAVLVSARMSNANLRGADLRNANLKRSVLFRSDLSRAYLGDADLSDANLSGVDLSEADLSRADLSMTDLTASNLTDTKLDNADLSGADLTQADLSGSDLSGANFLNTMLSNANFTGAKLDGANFSMAQMGYTIFGNNDLSTVQELDAVLHFAPSTIGLDTLFKSDGKISEWFLREAGVPEDFLTFLPSLVGRAIEFYSCFISFSYRDEDFSRRLHSRMRGENLRVWYAPEDMKSGRKVHEEIFRAIQVHDKLLLVLSENSMKSEWVATEIRRAMKVEREENRRKLFPIRLVDFDALQKLECFDADSGKDLAVELREYYIPDFSNWKDPHSFEVEFAKLLRDLRATET